MTERLAIDGGRKACPSWPERHLFGKAEQRAVNRLFERCIRIGRAIGYDGTEETAYCEAFAEFLGGGYADAVSSGTSAVYVALKAARIPAFSEVICSPVTDPGGVMPIPLAGCIPVPADVAPGTFSIDPDSVAERVTKRTSAIVVAHIAGLPADMAPIMRIARRHKLVVIEDCAQAHGATYDGKPVGTIGHFGAFSTMSGKHHATGAQGGVVFTRNRQAADRVRRYSDRGKPFGLKRSRGNVVASLNFNLNDLAACIGRVQLRKLPAIIRKRREAARWLIAACRRELSAVRILDGLPRTEPVYWFLMGQLDLSKLRADKAAFVRALAAEGVPCDESYRHLFSEQDWYVNREVFTGTDYPWGSPLYKGDATREYPTPNVYETDARTFKIQWHENCGKGTARRLLAALKKVERAFAG